MSAQELFEQLKEYLDLEQENIVADINIISDTAKASTIYTYQTNVAALGARWDELQKIKRFLYKFDPEIFPDLMEDKR